MHTADQSNQPLTPSGRNRPLRRVFLVVALLLFGAGWLARIYLFDAYEFQRTLPAPERKGLPAPFITSNQPIVEKMVELAELSEDDLVYDLGCGDGRIVITAAFVSGCRGVGFDIAPERVAESQENARHQKVDDRVTFKEQDVFTVDLSEADVAMAYLLPWMLDKLRPQFAKMKPGARIVLHDFWIEGVEPDQFVELKLPDDGGSIHGIYVYVLPLKLNPHLEKLKPPRPRNWKEDQDARPDVPPDRAGAEPTD